MAPTTGAVRLPARTWCATARHRRGQAEPDDAQRGTTLFHEFGHALQHMLTTESCGPVAGINQVDWDAVELPSQFMENWCYDKKVLR